MFIHHKTQEHKTKLQIHVELNSADEASKN